MSRRLRRARGFTLVELMVALSGGLFVSLAVFALARDAGRFYQRESRLASATLGAISGFQRLRDDIARAGYMSSPNVTRDIFNCTPPAGNWPLQLRSLASVQIQQNVLTTNPVLTAANRRLDRIILAGSYSSSDQFALRQIIDNGSSYSLVLNPNSAAMNRLGYASSPTVATLQTVFMTGRAVRIVDTDGQQYFGNIAGATGGANPAITLAAAPALTFRQNSGRAGCGIKGYGTGALVNVVNFIQYSVDNLSGDSNYTALYTASNAGGAVPGEANRTELVRVELNTAGTPIAGTQELVAEYAVDLQFGISAVTSITGTTDPVVSYLPPSAANFATFTGAVTDATVMPERIRSVRVRLGVRSREADRDADIGSPTSAQGLYRINVNASGTAQYARVRTFQSDVTLMNQAKVLW